MSIGSWRKDIYGHMYYEAPLAALYPDDFGRARQVAKSMYEYLRRLHSDRYTVTLHFIDAGYHASTWDDMSQAYVPKQVGGQDEKLRISMYVSRK